MRGEPIGGRPRRPGPNVPEETSLDPVGARRATRTSGEVVECELTDPASGNVYDTTVTLSDVDGTKYHVDVQVAETPQG